MAQKPSKRWVEMVEKERLEATIGMPPTKVIRCDDAVKLLSRQHSRFVRMVKKSIGKSRDARCICGFALLAALQQGGKT